MFKTVMKYGSIAGGVLAAVLIAPWFFRDQDAMLESMRLGEIVGYTTMLVATGLVFFALREHRARNLGGVMPFRTGLLTGIAVSAVAAGLFGLATVVLYAWMGPERTHAFMLAYVEYSAGTGDPETAMVQYESMRHLWANPWFQGFVMFATVFPIGVVWSLVSAALLRSRGA